MLRAISLVEALIWLHALLDAETPAFRLRSRNYHVQRERIEGVRDTMSDTGLDPRTLTVVERFEHTGKSGHAAAAQALAVNPRVTALVCTADVLALGAGLGALAGHRRAQAVLGHGGGRQSQVPVLALRRGEERTLSAVWHWFATTLHPNTDPFVVPDSALLSKAADHSLAAFVGPDRNGIDESGDHESTGIGPRPRDMSAGHLVLNEVGNADDDRLLFIVDLCGTSAHT